MVGPTSSFNRIHDLGHCHFGPFLSCLSAATAIWPFTHALSHPQSLRFRGPSAQRGKRRPSMEPQRMRMPHPNQLPDSPGSQSRWRSDRSTQDRLNSSTPMAVQIRSNQPLNVPPPLPPPRYVNDAYPEPHRLRGGRLSGGSIDEGYANSGGSTSFPKHWAKAMNEKRIPEHLEHPRRETAFVPSSLNRSPTDSDRRYETMRLQDEGYFSLSGPSPAVQQLVYAFSFQLCHLFVSGEPAALFAI